MVYFLISYTITTNAGNDTSINTSGRICTVYVVYLSNRAGV